MVQAALSLVSAVRRGITDTESLRNMQHQSFGFDMANRYIMHIDPEMAGFTPERLPAFFRQLRDNLAAIPG